MNNFPSICKDCQKRHKACHDTCEEYAEAKRKHEELKSKIRTARERQQDVDSVAFRKWTRKR